MFIVIFIIAILIFVGAYNVPGKLQTVPQMRVDTRPAEVVKKVKKSQKSVNFNDKVKQRVYNTKTGRIVGGDKIIKINDAADAGKAP